MADTGHTERHHPFIEELRENLTRSYVDMLSQLNGDIARELKRARGLSKGGPVLTLLQGGTAAPVANRGLENDLMKASSPSPLGLVIKATTKHVPVKGAAGANTPANKQKYKDRGDMILSGSPKRWHKIHTEVKGPKRKAKPEEAKEKKIGQWFKDEEGNVQFLTKPSEQFDTPLTEEEAKELPSNLASYIGQMDVGHLNELAEYLKVSGGVVDAYKDSVTEALLEGSSVEDTFVVNYAMAIALEDVAEEDKEAFEEDPDISDDLYAEGYELFERIAEKFSAIRQDKKWLKRSQTYLKKVQSQTIRAAEKLKDQKRLLKGKFEKLMAAPTDESAIRVFGLMHDLGLFTLVESANEAKKFTNNENDIRKLVGMLVLDIDRHSALTKLSHTMGTEQQMAMAMADIIGGADDAYQGGGRTAEDEYWADLDATDQLEDFFDQQDYSDAKQETVTKKIEEMAREVRSHVRATNEDKGGHVFRALQHKEVGFKKLFQSEKAVEELREAQAAKTAQIERALDAQKRTDHDIDPVVVEGLQQALKADGVKDWKKGSLFSFQNSAVGWMEEIEAGILAYDAGLGKTPISIAFISNLIKKGKAKRGVLVLPASLMAQWPTEIEKFRPGSKVQVISGGGGGKGNETYGLEERLAQIRAINSGELDADFVIMSAGTISSTSETNDKLQDAARAMEASEGVTFPRVTDEETGEERISIPKAARAQLLEEHGLLQEDELVQALKGLEGAWIYDEAHSGGQGLKDPTNMRHLISKEILSTKKYKFGMTATPMPNTPVDMFHIANLFNPGSAGESVAKFEGRLVNMKETVDPKTGRIVNVPEAMDMEDLREAKEALEPYVFMKRKSDQSILDEMKAKGMKLPKVNPVAHSLSLDPESKLMYRQAEEMSTFDPQTFGSAPAFDEKYKPPGGYGKDYVTDRAMYKRILERGGKNAELNASRAMSTRKFMRKQRASISPKLLDENYTGPQPKIDYIKDLVSRHFADPDNSDKPIVVFGSYKDSLNLTKAELMKAGIPDHLIGVIHGDVDQAERAATQDAINEGKMKIVLIGIEAGGAGLNLQKKAYRNIFLDKPWTPAAMEQAVGRTWRTGSKADTVHIHHMKVAGTTDENKYESLKGKISLTDSLAFAGEHEGRIAQEVAATQKRLVGSFNDDVTEWSPAQKKASLREAGLPDGDVPPLASIPSLREDFDFKAFQETIDEKKFYKFGADKLKTMHDMNGVLLRSGLRTTKEHGRKKKAIHKRAREWLSATKNSMDHPVAQFLGEDFHFASEGSSSVGGRKGMKAATKTKRPSKKSKELAKKVPPANLPVDPKQLKITLKSKFKLKGVSKNPFTDESLGSENDWALWEVFRKMRPKSFSDALKKTAQFLEDKQEAKKIVTLRRLQKFVKMGLVVPGMPK